MLGIGRGVTDLPRSERGAGEERSGRWAVSRGFAFDRGGAAVTSGPRLGGTDRRPRRSPDHQQDGR